MNQRPGMAHPRIKLLSTWPPFTLSRKARNYKTFGDFSAQRKGRKGERCSEAATGIQSGPVRTILMQSACMAEEEAVEKWATGSRRPSPTTTTSSSSSYRREGRAAAGGPVVGQAVFTGQSRAVRHNGRLGRPLDWNLPGGTRYSTGLYQRRSSPHVHEQRLDCGRWARLRSSSRLLARGPLFITCARGSVREPVVAL